MNRNPERALVTLLMLVLAVTFLYASVSVYVLTQVVATRIAAVTVAFLSLQLVLDLRPDWADYLIQRRWANWLLVSREPPVEDDPSMRRSETGMLLWIATLLVLITVIGMGPGVSAFLVLALTFYSRIKWPVALASGLAVWAVLHWGFYGGLGLRMYDGWLWRLL